MADFDELAQLKDKLYRRGQPVSRLSRSRLPAAEREANADWSEAPAAVGWLSPKLARRLAWWTLLFFLAMIGLTWLIFARGTNLVSSGNVALAVSGPEALRSGEELILEVSLENHNQSDLALVDLIMEYPAGTRSPVDSGQELARERFSLGTIKADGEIKQIVRAIMFGAADSQLPVRARIEYRLNDSNAIFDKQVTHQVKISGTPLVLNIEGVSTVNDRQDLVLKLELTSNTTVDLPELLLAFDYPSGFVFKEAQPAPQTDDRLWRISPLAPGARRTIRLTGTLSGQADEEKFFRLTVGTADAARPDRVAVPYGLAEHLVVISRPSVALGLTLNGDSGNEYIASRRELIQGEVTWVNNLTTAITDGEVALTLVGEAFDQNAVAVNRGFYNSGTKTIIWNKSSEPALAEFPPGASGRLTFNLPVASLVGERPIINPRIVLTARFQGRRVGDRGLTAIDSEASQTIKINSAVQLATRALHRSGQFANRGTLPPRVGQETSYTMVWSVVNSSNNLGETAVRAVLPPYVAWTGLFEPRTEALEFKPYGNGGGEVLWRLGQVAAGTGLHTAAREVAFQVVLTPSGTQIGQAPALILAPQFSAVDSFTGRTLSLVNPDVTTFLVSDPSFQYGEDKVMP